MTWIPVRGSCVSILSVALLYVLMNVAILSVLPAKEAMASKATKNWVREMPLVRAAAISSGLACK